MGEVFREMQKDKQERHARWHRENREKIVASGLPFIDRGEALLFRGKVQADFYPSTGRWRANKTTYKGGAKAFIAWLNRSIKNENHSKEQNTGAPTPAQDNNPA